MNVLGQETTMCDNCGLHNPTFTPINTNIHIFSAGTWRITNMHNLPPNSAHGSTEQCAFLYFKSLRVHTPCPHCRLNLQMSKTFNTLPRVIIIHLGVQSMQISHTINVHLPSGNYTYHLKGMIYFGNFHFTSQFVDNNRNIWYHDGIETGRTCTFEGALHTSTNNTLLHTHGKQLCTAIYSIT